jgi:hypothetical protein
MASSGLRNGGPRMSTKLDRGQGAGATPKTAAGKQRLSSAGGGAYRRTTSGPLPAAGGRASSDGGGCCWLGFDRAGAGSGFGFDSAGCVVGLEIWS